MNTNEKEHPLYWKIEENDTDAMKDILEWSPKTIWEILSNK